MALTFNNGGRVKAQFEIAPEAYLIISVSSTLKPINIYLVCFSTSLLLSHVMDVFDVSYVFSEPGKCLSGHSKRF